MRLRSSWQTFGFALLLLAGAQAAAAQPAFLVKDVNPSQRGGFPTWPFAAEFMGLGSQVIFSTEDGIHGFELWITDGTEAGTRLLKDICPGARSSGPAWLTPVGSRIFFKADDCVHGAELWVTDGTPTGTVMVADLVPGLAGSSPLYLTAFGSSVVFSAADPLHGNEVWISDGTAAGTVRLTDLSPVDPYASPVPWAALGSRFVFVADDAATGEELWTTDGTVAGTHLLQDVLPGTASSVPFLQPPQPGAMPFAVAGGKLFFGAIDGTSGRELWTTDGTEAGTSLLADLSAGPSSSSPYNFLAAGGTVFFAADDNVHGAELWKSDGTPAGTVPVKDIQSGYAGSNPRDLTAVGSTVYFTAQDGAHGIELWKSDGSEAGTAMVKDIKPGPDSGMFFFGLTLTALGGDLLFFADDGVHGVEPWRSDGTETGTSLLTDLHPGSPGSLYGLDVATSDRRAIAGGRWYFRAYPGDLGVEVWTSDGTPAGTSRLKEIHSQASAVEPFPVWNVPLARPMADLDGMLIFQASDRLGSDLWKTDGTAAGTVPLADLESGPATSAPQEMTVFGDSVLFSAATRALGWEPYSTDGTPAGTGLVKDLEASLSTGSNPSELTQLGGLVLFRAADRLWKSDGTAPGTTALQEASLSYPEGLEALGTAVLFRGNGAAGEELWQSDGTEAGTVQVLDIRPGSDSSSPNQITAAASLALFSADDGASGRELWKTDGTPAGTALVKDIRPGADGSIRDTWDDPERSDERFAAVGGTVFFPADDGVHGEELWKSDGTAAGTVLVADVFPGARSSDVRWLTAAGGRVFFVADDGVHGRELWVSDGTAAGTRLVLDVLPGPESSVPEGLFALGHLLLFSATDGVHGRELWRSNGVPAGTRQVQDVAPGPLSSSPFSFTPAGPNVYFMANDNATGFELWAIAKPALLATFQDVPADSWAWRFIEALTLAGVTSGCGQFCPNSLVNRAEAAVFLLAARDSAPPPPATGARFQDVPPGYWAGPWIEQLAAEGIVGGCSVAPPLYCPGNPLSRAEMAVLLVGARHETPPPATGTRFIDVPANHWAGRWIEQLAADGITSGCGGGRFCPDQPITRAEMAVFLAAAFNLPLP